MTQTKISASDFKAHCSEVIDRVSNGHGPVVITKHGKHVAMLVAIEEKKHESLFGFAKGYMKVHGDIMEPIEVDWQAVK